MDQIYSKIVVKKVDLDTIGCIYTMLVKQPQLLPFIEVCPNGATEKDILDSSVLVVEAGGSGMTNLNNFDHHDTDGLTENLYCATKQAWELNNNPSQDYLTWLNNSDDFPPLNKGTVEYIDILDRKGPDVLREVSEALMESGPFLSDLFSGIFLLNSDPEIQIRKGLEALGSLTRSFVFVAFFTLPEWAQELWYNELNAAKENNERCNELCIYAQGFTTVNGRKAALVETEFYGASLPLYKAGFDIIIVLTPDMKGIRKYAIGSNDSLDINSILPILNEKEAGWGLSATGTIIDSPINIGSIITVEEMIEIVKNNL